ncbi:hypothetical protein DFH27DRAFT_373132 [Peziza echinospora]|nr:hypothetical protein DFH27DRAFT_373132 [Peziza echinospora]
MDPKAESSQMGQVPIEAEDSQAPLPAHDDDMIQAAPPPYSQHVSTQSKSAGPPIEMVDLQATVRALPIVHMVAVPVPMPIAGASAHGGSSSRVGEGIPDAEINGFVEQPEHALVSPSAVPAISTETVQPVASPTHSDNPNSASTTSFRSDDTNVSAKGGKEASVHPVFGKMNGPEWIRKEVFGCNICFIIVGSIVGIIILAVTLAVTLNRGTPCCTQQNTGYAGDPAYFHEGKYILETNNTSSPSQYGSCLSPSVHLPEIDKSEQVLWSCERAQTTFNFEIVTPPYAEMMNERTSTPTVKTFPVNLPPMKATDFRYTSSYAEEYITSRKNITGFYEGVQPLEFFQVPLRQLKVPYTSTTEFLGNEFEFRFLYEKVIILRPETIQNLVRYRNSTIKDVRSIPGLYNNTRINELESVWRCVWNNTLIQGQLVKLEAVTSYNKTDGSGLGYYSTVRMNLNLTEMRPTIAQIEELFGPGPGIYAAGSITCSKMILEDGQLRKEVAGSSPIKMVESVETIVAEGLTPARLRARSVGSFPRDIGRWPPILQKRAETQAITGCRCTWTASGGYSSPLDAAISANFDGRVYYNRP